MFKYMVDVMKKRFQRLDNLYHKVSTEISKNLLEAADVMVLDGMV